MSKVISKTAKGSKMYIGAMSPQEIREADEFLTCLQREIEEFEKELEQKHVPSSLDYKYYIGEFLANKVLAKGIPSYERLYVWEEIRSWVHTSIETSKDRGKNRPFYEYCYRLYKYGKDLAFAFTWRQWCEFLDRSVTTKDIRLLEWLKIKIRVIKDDDMRMFLLVVNQYLSNHDTTIFDDEELYKKYDFLLEIVNEWNENLSINFKGDTKNLSRARRKNVTKFKKKFVVSVLQDSRFKSKDMLKDICVSTFKRLFVDIDTSSRFDSVIKE